MTNKDMDSLIKYKGQGSYSILYYFSFIVWPFGTMLLTIKNRYKSVSKNILWIFFMYFGFTFIITNEGVDSTRYATTLADLRNSGFSWSAFIDTVYSSGSNLIDIVQPVITFIVSLMTGNPAILFTVFALIFGYFYSRNIFFLLNRLERGMSWVIFFYVVTFILINPIWNINGFRMYAAAQVFIFGLFPYLFDGKIKPLWWSLISVFFHFSFIIPVLILLSYFLLKNRLNLFFLLFIITALIESVNLQEIRNFLGFLPDFIQPRLNIYTNVEYASRVAAAKQTLNWYVPVSERVISWIVYVFSVIIYTKNRNYLIGPFLNLFCFGLWFYSWANLLSLVPSGGRFISIANLIMVTFIIIYLKYYNGGSIVRIFSRISVLGLIIFILVQIRIGFEFMGVSTLLGNPLLSLFWKDNTPLIMYIKNIF